MTPARGHTDAGTVASRSAVRVDSGAVMLRQFDLVDDRDRQLRV
jgi:hypothetical protein